MNFMCGIWYVTKLYSYNINQKDLKSKIQHNPLLEVPRFNKYITPYKEKTIFTNAQFLCLLIT